MSNSDDNSISIIGWKCMSVNADMSWSDALDYWFSEDLVNTYNFGRYIYSLGNQNIPIDESLNLGDWQKYDTTDVNLILNKEQLYWIHIESEIEGGPKDAGAEGPKVNWKVEYKDILTGELLYDGDIRSDSNGMCNRPNFSSTNDVYEVVFSCVDSSGYDLLTGETSTIGEKLSAVVEKNNNDRVQATQLSSILADDLKDSGNVSLDNYKSKKKSIEDSLGIEDINTNPYDTTEDSEKCLRNSEEIMKISSFLDGMESLLSDNSSKSSDEIKREIRKALLEKLENFSTDSSGTEDTFDLSNENNVSDLIEKAGQQVVDNGTDVNTLKTNGKGISSFVKTIKDTMSQSDSLSFSDKLIEIHKTQKAIKETIKNVKDEGGNYTNDLSSNVNDKKGTLDFSKYNDPTYKPSKIYVANNGKDSFRRRGTINDPYATLSYAWKRSGNKTKNIFIREGTYFMPEFNVNKRAVISGYNNENVIFDGTKSINDLKDKSSEGKWKPIEKTVVNDKNEIENTTIYRIKLRENVKIWQLFHNHEEVINARWPSAQWKDDSVFDINKWGHGYYNYSDVAGTIRDYDNGEIVDIPHNDINLYDFVEKQRTINDSFDIKDSLIHLNVGSFKSYTKIVKETNIDSSNNIIRLNYDQVDLWKTKHHYYYLENKLEYLNSENEWYFDNENKYLYVRLSRHQIPSNLNIRAKVENYALNISAKNVKIEKINFFGTTFKANNADYLLVKNCNFLYPSCYAHMLGQINSGHDLEPANNEVFETNTRIINSSKCIIDKCAFKYIDGDVLHVSGGSNTLRDSYISYVDKTVCNLSSVMTTLRFGGDRNLIRNNTIHKTAASSTINPGNKSIVEFNNLFETGYLQSDGSMIHLMVNQQLDAKIRYNWVHDTIKYGIRCDGDGDGNGCYIHHNIGWNCNGGIMVKGGILDDNNESVGGHYVYNNTFFNSFEKNDIMALNVQAGKNINYGTVVMNNLCENLSGHRSDSEDLEPRMFDINNYTNSDVEIFLRNYSNNDFRPKPDNNNIVNAGQLQSPSDDFKPFRRDRLTRDIGAMMSNKPIWKGGITWNKTMESDEDYVNRKRFSFISNTITQEPVNDDNVYNFYELTSEYSVLDEQDKSYHNITGTISYIDLEGGFYGVTTNDNSNYLPINIQLDLKKHNTKKIQISGYSKSDTVSFFMWGTMIYAENWTFIDEGNSIEILPVAYAYVNSNNYNATNQNERKGVNISWSQWNNSTNRHTFTFDTPMSDANYNVVTDRNYESTNAIHIFGKSNTQFTAEWENGNPEVWGGTFIIYPSTPTKTIYGTGGSSVDGASSSPVTITVESEYISSTGTSEFRYITSDSNGNGGLFGSINAIRGSTLTIHAVGEYADLVTHPITITEYNDQGQQAVPLTNVIRTETDGPNNDGTYTLTWVVPNDMNIDKYQYQCETHAHMRGTIHVISSSIEILPAAYAHVNYNNYNAINQNERKGVNISWSPWNDNTSEHVFSFDTPMSDANYSVVTDRNYENTNALHIHGKSNTQFTAYWENGNPEVWDGTFIIYPSIPTKEIGGGAFSIEILPVAYAYVNYDNYNAINQKDRKGVNISWSPWNNYSKRHTFTFDTPMENTNYNVVTDRNYESTNCIHIFWKYKTGFTAQWDNGNPQVWAGSFVVYASDPTKQFGTKEPEPEPEPELELEPQPEPEPEPEQQLLSNYVIVHNVPNWLQPSSYSNTIDPNYVQNFKAWCSPTSAANQLGHLVDSGLLPVPPQINDNIIAGTEMPHSSPASTFNWDTARGWGDYLLDGPGFRGQGLLNGVVTDFGWYMDTNNMGMNSSTSNSPVGTTINCIYDGIQAFYSKVGWSDMVGIAYNKGSMPMYNGKFPDYWLTYGYDESMAFDYNIMLSTIKYEIDNNRTVIACYNGWHLTYISNYSTPTSADNEGAYYKFNPSPDEPNINNETGEQYTITIPDGDADSYGSVLGHTVLIVGYISAGSLEDIHGNTDWLIVRDNQQSTSGTHRNVIIPYYDHNNNDPSGWDKLLATLFVNPSLGIYNEIQPEPEPAQDEPTTIYVSGGSFSYPYYQFYSDSAGANQIDGLYLSDAKYEFKRLNNATSHPFFISDVGYKDPSNILTFTGDINHIMGIRGSQSFIVSLNDLPTSSPIYYYCTAHYDMRSTFNYYNTNLNSPEPEPEPQQIPFNLNYVYTDSVTDTLKEHMLVAVDIVEGIIDGYKDEISDIATNLVTIDEDNLSGNTLGEAWPSAFKIVINSSNSNYGNVGLGTKNGTIGVHISVVVLVHEIIHILGIGTNYNAWYNNLVNSPANGERKFYTGTNAVREYKTILTTNGYSYTTITGIPVEDDFGAGTVNSHFEEGLDDDANYNMTNDEFVYDGSGIQHPVIPKDIMTGFIDADINNISGITLGVLEDIGYFVNYDSLYCTYNVYLQFEN